MRAALLPTPGNPQMLAYWLRNFETWREHVDELVILVNGAPDMELLRNMVTQPNVTTYAYPERIGHDRAIDLLLSKTGADHVVLCEDDAYVRHPQYVEWAFHYAERGGFAGSPRHEDYVDQRQTWGPYQAHHLEELRHGFWPAFFFAERSALLATDRIFGDCRWNLGDEIRDWGRVTPEVCEYVGIAPDYVHLDTLFGTTFQLRAAHPAADLMLVHHVRLFDAEATEEWIVEDPPWFHITGLSTLDQLDWPLDRLPDYGPGGGLWTRRLAWWRRVGIDIEPFLARANVDRDELRRWDERFELWAPTAVTA